MPNYGSPIYKYSCQRIAFFLVSVSLLVLSCSPGITEGPTLEGKKIIFVYGGMQGHSPKESADLFVPLLEKEGASVEVFDNFSVYEDEKLMSETDLIIQAFTDAFTPPETRMNARQFKGLQVAILNGTGFAGWHGGLGDSNRTNQRYQFIVGGQFVSHPGGKTNYSVKISDKDDLITQGIRDFDLNDTEQYYTNLM